MERESTRFKKFEQIRKYIVEFYQDKKINLSLEEGRTMVKFMAYLHRRIVKQEPSYKELTNVISLADYREEKINL